MAPATVREHLQRVLAAENVPCDDGSLRLLARASRGSMRDGLSLTDQAIAYGGGRLSESVVRTMLGSVDRGHARALVLALAARDGAAVLAAVQGLRGLALSAAGTLEELALLLQQMAVEQAVPGALDAQDPDTEDGRALAAVLAPDETQLLYSMVVHGRQELSLMSDEYGALTMVLLRFLAFPAAAAGGAAPSPAPVRAAVAMAVAVAVAAPTEPMREAREPRAAPLRAPAPPALTLPASAVTSTPALVARAGSPPPPWDVPQVAVASASVPTFAAVLSPFPGPVSAPVHAQRTTAISAVQALPALAETALGDRWYALVKPLCEQGVLSALARELALQAGLRAIDANASPERWHLVVERETLRSVALRDKLTAAVTPVLGRDIEFELEAGFPNDSPARRDLADKQRRQAEAEALIQSDPVVRELLSQFKTARIVPGSIKPIQP
jgi:DNA polymerase-3 subunit gamma/tau